MNLSSFEYRTARNLRVVPYNRVRSVLHEDLAPAGEFTEDGYGFAIQEHALGTTDNHVSDETPLQLSEIDQEAALLLLSVQEPGLLPDYLAVDQNPVSRRGLLNLIYAGLIEIRVDQRFLTAAEAAKFLQSQHLSTRQHSVDNISHQALQLACELDLLYADQLFNYLYQFQPIPVSVKRRESLCDDKAFLQLAKLEQTWRYSNELPGWHYFSKGHARRNNNGAETSAKLYLSPTVDDLPFVLHELADTLTVLPEASFKVGQGAEGLLRPDKLVAYFTNLESLLEVAEKLQKKLYGLDAHGVPFTAQYTTDGLISWGIDPLQKNGDRQSWRQWVIGKLVDTMLTKPSTELTSQAHADGSEATPSRWQLALAQLELEGINPNTFRPGALWINEYS